MKYNFTYLPHTDFSNVPKAKCENETHLLLGKRHWKEIEKGYLVESEVVHVNEKVGAGLITKSRVKKGAYVGEYTGIVGKNDYDYFAPLNDYLFAYPVKDEIDRNYVIDATSGHYTRFINHSYTPNLKQFYAFFDGYYHLIFVANRDIEVGEHLSYNYGKDYWSIRYQPVDINSLSQ